MEETAPKIRKTTPKGINNKQIGEVLVKVFENVKGEIQQQINALNSSEKAMQEHSEKLENFLKTSVSVDVSSLEALQKENIKQFSAEKNNFQSEIKSFLSQIREENKKHLLNLKEERKSGKTSVKWLIIGFTIPVATAVMAVWYGISRNEKLILLEEKNKQQENVIYTQEAFFEAYPKTQKIYDEWVQKQEQGNKK